MQADHSVMIDEQKLNEEYKKFVTEYMSECSTYELIHKQIKDFKIIGGKEPTLKQKAFALMYRYYIDFPDDLPPIKNAPHLIFLAIYQIVFSTVSK